jgi:transcriptional regulator with PAS, ATPase and Fis domain
MTLQSKLEKTFDPWTATLADMHSEDLLMVRCLDLAKVAAQTDLPILILGESGTGKTLLARAIHNSSSRARQSFVSFNAAALSDTLLDSQLFGHEKGAFTGADKPVKGKFELAHGGTIFIDEIADMSLTGQAKILRAVEYGEFERLGSEKLQKADVRVISATHWPLAQFTASERFRRDLFYRLSGIILTIPPLRERLRDLPHLIAAEIAVSGQRQRKQIKGMDAAVSRRLMSYSWPGNLRELSRVIHTAIALSPGEIIPAEAILLEDSHVEVVPPRTVTPPPPSPADPTGNNHQALKNIEHSHIRSVLEQLRGNKRQAARALGISRSTLDRKLAAGSKG